MPVSLQAGLWGLLSGSALVLGALVGYYARPSARLVAGTMAFGSGVLISALSFDLMDEAYRGGGFAAVSVGFLGGALVYTLANVWLARSGARHRKRSNGQQPSEDEHAGSGTAIAVGALLDGIPESIVIGVSFIGAATGSWITVLAIFLSNIPEGLSSSAGMRKAGRSAGYVFAIWTGIALVSGLAAFVGYTVFAGFDATIIAATTAVAAGAILAMLSDTMIPEAFETAHNYAGLITVLGFLCAFLLTKAA